MFSSLLYSKCDPSPRGWFSLLVLKPVHLHFSLFSDCWQKLNGLNDQGNVTRRRAVQRQYELLKDHWNKKYPNVEIIVYITVVVWFSTMSKAPPLSGEEMGYLSHFPLLLHFNFMFPLKLRNVFWSGCKIISFFKLTWMLWLSSDFLFWTGNSVSPKEKKALEFYLQKRRG